MEKLKFKEKLEEIKQKGGDALKSGLNSACKAYYDHEQEIRVLAPVIVALGGVGIKKGLKAHRKNQEIKERDCSHYDPRCHTWYYSKKPLSTKQKLRLDELYESGMNKGEALKKMGLLKW